MTKKEKEMRREPGVGFDFGTSFLVSSEQKGTKVSSKSLRDCYVALKKSDVSKELLKDFQEVLYFETEDRIIVLSDKAWKLSGSMGYLSNKDISEENSTTLKTPMYKGFINPDDQDAYDILKKMAHSLVGEPVADNEVVYFSVPAAPLDDEDQDEIYHRSLLEDLFSSLGYDARYMNEAHAIAFSECQKEGFSGLCISWGHGMTNFCLTVDTVESLSFSVARGGSYIDKNAAKSLRANPVLMQSIKESVDFDLMSPKNREERAIQAYYKELIRYALAVFKKEFARESSRIYLSLPIPLVISGGTSLPKGFIDLFKQCMGKLEDFPLKLSEIRHASDPLKAVSKGLLIKARSES